jgi:hypothetical protein
MIRQERTLRRDANYHEDRLEISEPNNDTSNQDGEITADKTIWDRCTLASIPT